MADPAPISPQGTPPGAPEGGSAPAEPALLRLFARVQRLYARLDDLDAFLDLLAETLVEILEETEPIHAAAAHRWGAAGLISREPGHGVFRPLRLEGRPDPDELRSFVEHVGPGDSAQPTGLMGWSAARRKVALRRRSDWYVADRDDERDRWRPLRSASPEEAAEMRGAAIAAYPSVQAQLAVPILDPEIRGQARPRQAIGILNVESDEPLGDRFNQVMIAFAGAIGHPLMAALRHRDLACLARDLARPLGRGGLARSLLQATLPYLPRRERRGWMAIRDFRTGDCYRMERVAGPTLPGGLQERYHAGELVLDAGEGLWGQAIRTRRVQYLPDVPRLPQGLARPLWPDSQSALLIPLVSGDEQECLGLLGLESGETSYVFSTQDQRFLETAAALAAVAIAGIREPRLEYSSAIRVPALLQRLRCARVADLPDDQIVRVNAICRALIKHGFVFQKAAEETRLSVHVLREYTSRSPRIVDVPALRVLAMRRAERVARAASGSEA